MKFKDKLVLITGATRGLGYQLALEFGRAGAHVIALGRNQGALDDLADEFDELPGAITQVPMDITDDNAIAYLGQSIFERWKHLDLWAHCAWFTPPLQPVPHMIAKDLDTIHQTNIRATARLIAMLDPILRTTKDARAIFFDDPSLKGAHHGGNALSKRGQMEIVKAWAEEAKTIGPKVEIFTPSPFYGQNKRTLYPGMAKEALGTARDEARKIVDTL